MGVPKPAAWSAGLIVRLSGGPNPLAAASLLGAPPLVSPGLCFGKGPMPISRRLSLGGGEHLLRL